MKSHDERSASRECGHRKSQNVKSTKKTYRSPELFIYGDIREITQGVGSSLKADMGGPGKT